MKTRSMGIRHLALALALLIAIPPASVSANANETANETANGSSPTRQKSPDMTSYMNGVKTKIQSAWRHPDVPQRCIVSVLFSVDKNGALVSNAVKQSSGNPKIDQLAVAAIKKAAPFAKLPDGAGKFSVEYSFECGQKNTTDAYMFNGVPIKNQEYKMSSGGSTLRPLDSDSAVERKLQDRAAALRDKADSLQRKLDELQHAGTPDDAKLSAAMRDLAGVHKQLQQYDKAEPLYKSAVALDEKSGEQNASLVNTLFDFANLYYMMGKYAEAEPLYERSISMQNKMSGQQTSKQILTEYAKTMYKLNKASQADEIYKQLRAK